MAQIKVTEFFATRKRNPDSHPSKRQKLRDPGVFITHNDSNVSNAVTHIYFIQCKYYIILLVAKLS